jgi:hypothetical protein
VTKPGPRRLPRTRHSPGYWRALAPRCVAGVARARGLLRGPRVVDVNEALRRRVVVSSCQPKALPWPLQRYRRCRLSVRTTERVSSLFEDRCVEVHQQSNSKIQGLQIRQHLETMDGTQLGHHLHLDENRRFDQQIYRLTRDLPLLVADENILLSLESEFLRVQFEAQCPSVNPLAKAWSEGAMDRERTVHHPSHHDLGFRRER